MVAFRQHFANTHVILPVIHVTTLEQAQRNTNIAREAGADGVFLIGHGMPTAELLAIHKAVVAEHPSWWVGVNCLDLTPMCVFERIDATVAGVWADNAKIDERATAQSAADEIQAVRAASGWEGLYFGGVAFKYQRPVDDLTRAARIAARYMDVVTTSGPGTGHSASLEKIRTMKQAIGDAPLAIASGMTPDNVSDYLDCADCFLVATGISRSFEELDPPLAQRFVKVVRQGSAE